MITEIPLMKAKEGMILANDVYKDGICLVPGNKPLTKQIIELLKKRRVLKISVFM